VDFVDFVDVVDGARGGLGGRWEREWGWWNNVCFLNGYYFFD